MPRRNRRPIQLSTVGLLTLVAVVLSMASCRSPHTPESRAESNLEPGWPRANAPFQQVSYHEVRGVVPTVAGAEYVNDDEMCMTCHATYAQTFAHNVHRNNSCEDCHGPASRHLEARGKEPGLIVSFKSLGAVERAEACLRCHEENQCSEGTRWRTSKHANCGVSCTDCHRAHYNVPEGTPATNEPTSLNGLPSTQVQLTGMNLPEPKAKGNKPLQPSLRGTSSSLGAVSPNLCYKCHCDKQVYQQIAGPHQICGPNGFNCTTCHDPHGNIVESSRKDLCLQCHKGHPLQGWYSSTHERHEVACTDCHNPHPRTDVPENVLISRTDVKRPKRLAMSVQEPEACFKCHPKIFGLASLPSHHPIKEGKMVCSDCHDAHGQFRKGLKADSVNMVCYECHMEKEGPFVWEHPPVTENCAICHEPHGTVTNNLLRQPTTFLCLRCHVGHRKDNRNPDNVPASTTLDPSNPDALPNDNFEFRQVISAATYTNCVQCHASIHGSDIPSQSRRGRLTR